MIYDIFTESAYWSLVVQTAIAVDLKNGLPSSRACVSPSRKTFFPSTYNTHFSALQGTVLAWRKNVFLLTYDITAKFYILQSIQCLLFHVISFFLLCMVSSSPWEPSVVCKQGTWNFLSLFSYFFFLYSFFNSCRQKLYILYYCFTFKFVSILSFFQFYKIYFVILLLFSFLQNEIVFVS